jgi:hypothetical protein
MARTAAALVVALLLVNVAQARVWTDASGKYSFEADLIAFNETDLVLQKPDKTLVAVDFEQLSAEDQKYVQSKEAADSLDKLRAKKQVWKMRSGLEVIGNVVDYVRKDVTFSMTRGKIYINDRLFENLTEIQQRIVPLIAAHFTDREITDRAGLFDWLRRRRGEPITFTVEGVQMELENGDLYGVPFFMFSDQALAALKPGWEQWAAKTSTFEHQQESELRLQTAAQSFHEGQAQTNQLLKMQLQLQAFQSGLLWEVMLYPEAGTLGWPLYVVVPGRDSRQAGWNALANNPGYTLGPIARVSPRF